jgi:hypothetical protein
VPDLEPTREERRAIDALKKVARDWPKSLWLFSASGSLCVMRKGANGERMHTRGGGVDPDYEIDEIHGIENDGGDW